MRRATLLASLASLLGALPAPAIIFSSTGSTTFNTMAPGGIYANSGWQYEGQWQGLTGIPIAPNYFVTAEHISIGSNSFIFNGVPYTVDSTVADPNSDLRIGHIVGTFPTWAPLYLGSSEAGKEAVLFGRGTQRGADRNFEGNLRGWDWGPSDLVLRWGTNTIDGVANGGAQYGNLLTGDFDFALSGNEAAISLNDSGGGLFIKDTDDVWKLAGIHFGTSGPYYPGAAPAGQFNAALFNQTGFFVDGSVSGTYVPATGPGSFFSTRISSNFAFIQGVTGIPEPSTALALVFGAGMALAGRQRRSSRA